MRTQAAGQWPSGLNPQPYLDFLAVEKGASPHTVSNYTRDLLRYVDFLQSTQVRQLAEVTSQDVESFVAFLGQGDTTHPPLGPASIRRSLSAARSWHRFALENGEITRDVAATVKPSKPGKHLPNVLSVEQTQRLLEAASSPDNPMALRDRALLEFLYATGARISEATALAVDDLDLGIDPVEDGFGRGGAGWGFGAGGAPVEDGSGGYSQLASGAGFREDGGLALVRLFGKGRKERLAILGSFAVQALEAYLVGQRPALAAKGKSRGAVFLNTLGRPLSRQSAWAIIQQAARRSGLDQTAGHQIGPHTLRHCFATHLLAGGADVRVVQELLGHASVSTTQIYTNITRDMIKEVYASSHPRAVTTKARQKGKL